MKPALERIVIPAVHGPARPSAAEADKRLNVSVIFTSFQSTLAAVKRAGALARSLDARITILATQVVPFPLPLESPPVLLDWSEARFTALAAESPLETVVRFYLCRDKLETLKGVLNPKSLVVIGGRKGFWPATREKRLARRLRRAGHQVIFTETE